MTHIKLTAKNFPAIRFRLYNKKAPITCEGILKSLPISEKAFQARFAGEEIWIKDGPALNIPKENSTKKPKIGGLGYAPNNPKSEVTRNIAIIYGEAKLVGSVNIFARVYEEDLNKLKKLGEKIWLKGARELKLELGQ